MLVASFVTAASVSVNLSRRCVLRLRFRFPIRSIWPRRSAFKFEEPCDTYACYGAVFRVGVVPVSYPHLLPLATAALFPLLSVFLLSSRRSRIIDASIHMP